MKKLISLLLVIIITCSTLAGCEWQRLFDYITPSSTTPKWEAPEGVIETLTVDESGNDITIAHSDNFTQDDIEFVLMLHNKIRSNAIIDRPPNYLLYDVLTFAQNGYPLFLAHFENPYFICAYLKPDASEYELNEWREYEFDVTKYVWYKFETAADIPDFINGMQLTKETYLLYECTIVKDIASGIEYNKSGKYYMTYENQSDYEIITSKMLLYYDYPSWITGESKFIPYVKYGASTIEIYTDEENIDYLYFLFESAYQDGTGYVNSAINIFVEHYYALSSYFEILNEYIGYNDRIVKDAGIRLDIIVEYLVNGM